MELRPYQTASIDSLRANLCRGIRRQLLVVPTGGGKTVIAASLVRAATAKGSRILFLAHRKELIEQASSKLDGFGVEHGIIMANHWRRRPAAPVQVASVQTLIRRELPAADLIIIDEAHRSVAQSYRDIIDAYPRAAVIGLSATPVRADGRGLGDLYTDMVQVTTVAGLIVDGHLVTPRHFAPSRPDLAGVHLKRGDFDESELAARMDRPDLVGDIVGHWRRLAAERLTVVFAVNVEHSRHLVATFQAAGVPAEHLDGTTPAPEREAILRRLALGQTRVVSNVGILTEGWDLPACACVVLARPTQSLALYLQMAGRALRPAPGKTDCLILDHAGCAHAHGLVTEPRDWTLEPTRQRGKKAAAAMVRTCDRCYAAYPAQQRACPACGHAALVEAREIQHDTRGTLVEVDAETIARERKREIGNARSLDELQRIARERGYKPGWAQHIWAARQKRQGVAA